MTNEGGWWVLHQSQVVKKTGSAELDADLIVESAKKNRFNHALPKMRIYFI